MAVGDKRWSQYSSDGWPAITHNDIKNKEGQRAGSWLAAERKKRAEGVTSQEFPSLVRVLNLSKEALLPSCKQLSRRPRNMRGAKELIPRFSDCRPAPKITLSSLDAALPCKLDGPQAQTWTGAAAPAPISPRPLVTSTTHSDSMAQYLDKFFSSLTT